MFAATQLLSCNGCSGGLRAGACDYHYSGCTCSLTSDSPTAVHQQECPLRKTAMNRAGPRNHRTVQSLRCRTRSDPAGHAHHERTKAKQEGMRDRPCARGPLPRRGAMGLSAPARYPGVPPGPTAECGAPAIWRRRKYTGARGMNMNLS